MISSTRSLLLPLVLTGFAAGLCAQPEAPEKKPVSFKGDALKSTEGLSKGDMFGYEHEGRWYVGQVDRVEKGGQVFVDSLHPDNGELTTLKYIGFDGDPQRGNHNASKSPV